MPDYTETRALIAALEEDDVAMNLTLSQMTGFELRNLRKAASRLSMACGEWIEAGGVEL